MYKPQLIDRNKTPLKLLSLIALMNVPYSIAASKFNQGMIDERHFRIYRLIWSWSTPRMGGDVGRQHDRVYERLGKDAYYRRIERAHRLYEAWMRRQLDGYLVN